MQDIFLFIQHHWLLSVAFVIVLIGLMVLEFIKLQKGTQQTSPQQAVLLINRDDAVVVDLRHPDAFMTGHIVDAISIPRTELEAKYKKLEKFKSKPIVIACATGIESGGAATFLTKQGFDVRILAGGLRGWKEAELPLVKGN